MNPFFAAGPALMLLIMLLVYGFVLYFLLKVLEFMRTKSEHDARLIEKLEQLIQLHEKNNRNDE